MHLSQTSILGSLESNKKSEIVSIIESDIRDLHHEKRNVSSNYLSMGLSMGKIGCTTDNWPLKTRKHLVTKRVCNQMVKTITQRKELFNPRVYVRKTPTLQAQTKLSIRVKQMPQIIRTKRKAIQFHDSSYHIWQDDKLRKPNHRKSLLKAESQQNGKRTSDLKPLP